MSAWLVHRLCSASAAIALALWPATDAKSPGSLRERPPLDLDVFEDDDCLEAEDAEVLLSLMHDMADLLDKVLLTAPDEREGSWVEFDLWQKQRLGVMMELAGGIFGRPYCEPGKVAWMATECLLVLRNGGEQGPDDALRCAEALDEDFLTQITPRGSKFQTRLHLMLRSPWPGFRLLDLLVRLHPESGTTRMGGCKRFQNWQSEPDVFDWSWFKALVTNMADTIALNPTKFELRPSDGPLSRQYRARWLRTHAEVPGLREGTVFSDDVFDAYREHHYKAGCHLGVITSYVLQVLLVNLRDVEGRMHRYAASVAQLINLHAPFPHTVRSDWPVFRLLYLVSQLQRSPPEQTWEGGDQPRARVDATKVLVDQLDAGVAHLREDDFALVTAAWGHLSRFAGSVMSRLRALAPANVAVVCLALDAEALLQCQSVEGVLCVDAPRRLGVEGVIAKYLALAAITRLGVPAAWMDLDVYATKDPTPTFRSALQAVGQPDLVFSGYQTTESVSPAVVVAQASEEATQLLLAYASWLRENPFLLDHRGWDQFLNNRWGDFAGGFDYQGRNVTVKDDEGPKHSFPPACGIPPDGVRYAMLGIEFGSGDGWQGSSSFDTLALFHFWGAEESQERLFEVFYPHLAVGALGEAEDVLAHYRRVLVSPPAVSAFLGSGRAGGSGGSGRSLHLVAISYADGCCQKSIRKNRRQALAKGVDEARSYSKQDLAPSWAEKHEDILSQRKGAGWWLWKPYMVLKTLKDPSVPWHRGVVIWVDAGNYLHEDPRPLVTSALRSSDVTAMRLKWCLESDWTSSVTLDRLNVSGRYSVTDSTQIGAYFLVFRKTQLTIDFVERWLRLSEDRATLLGAAALHTGDDIERAEAPGFQRHQADQSIFSILFKEQGFHAMSLEEGHGVVTLARWRE